MRSRSDVKARPHARYSTRHANSVTTSSIALLAGIDPETLKQLNAHQTGRSWALPLADGESSRIPAWGARKTWLRDLAAALNTDVGRETVARRHTSVDKVLEIAPVVAAFADSTTGRGLTASVDTLAARAGCSTATMKRVRRVLRDLRFAVEMRTGRHLNRLERAAAQAHHGGLQTASASVWHLTLPSPTTERPARPLAPRRASASLGRIARGAHIAAALVVPPEGVDCDPLISRTQVREEPSVENSSSVLNESFAGKKSPTRARTRAHASEQARVDGKNPRKRRKTRKNRPDTPRPLHLQLAAAELVTRCHGMDRNQWIRLGDLGSRTYIRRHNAQHIGAIADALADAGIDTTRFDGHAIAERLGRHTSQRGLTWPDHIHNPVGFLRNLLRRIDWTTDYPPCTAAESRARRRARIAAEEESWRREAAEHARWRTAAPEQPFENPRRPIPGVRSLADDLAAAVDGTCAVCSSASGTTRHELPLPMPVCDQCWNVYAVEEPACCAEEAQRVAGSM